MLRVGVVGAAGRMGSLVCLAVEADPDLELVAAVDPAGRGASAAAGRLEVSPDRSSLKVAGAEVVVDFSHIGAAMDSLEFCAGAGIHVVMGTSGFDPDRVARARELFPSGAGRPNCIIVANFALSAVLAVRFAELAAPWFETAEVIELHHNAKIDAPSGTAISTAERMGRARGDSPWAAEPTTDEVLPGARGGLHDSGIHIHSVRMSGMVAHEEIILGTTGQTLTIRQDSYDRQSYMPGVVMAVKAVPGLEGVTVGLERVLGI
ncbi:MAG TPA: 4-hydroxy-tetrahydrodipicolinate reductase [Acidimicrobiales bacterium]|nr:4-hydroxy-tetrahydrodipicolinate reductase [Acidimicrobiales bacterium]